MVSVPATSANLGPGFDCLGAALGLYNRIEVSVLNAGSRPSVKIHGCGAGTLPDDRRNLVYRVIEGLFRDSARRCPGLAIVQHNAIPLARGLGSSAAAIVGGLTLGNALLGGRYTREELIDRAVAIEGHADNVVPACVGGLCIVRRERSRVLWWRTGMARDLRACVCVPAFTVATRGARRLLPARVTRATAIYTAGGAAFLAAAAAAPQSAARDRILCAAMGDRFHQPYRRRLIRGMDAVFTAAREAGALGVALSGSGPSVIALVASAAAGRRVAARMRAAFRRVGVASEALQLSFAAQGVRVV